MVVQLVHCLHETLTPSANAPRAAPGLRFGIKTRANVNCLEPYVSLKACEPHSHMKMPPATLIAGLFPVILFAGSTHLQAASTVQFSAANYRVAEGAGSVALTVQRTGDVNTVVAVDYACADVTATNGVKYTSVSGTLTFAAGATNQIIEVPILNESLVEGTKTFQVVLSNPTAEATLGSRTSATVVIADNDTGVEFEFGSYSVAEDAGSVLIGVVRGDDGDFPISVEYATTNATATAGADYKETSGILQFAAGEKVKLFTAPILNDGVKETSKSFRVNLSTPTEGGVLGRQKTATVTIVDNDPGVRLEFAGYWIQENEGAATVKVLRGHDVDLPPFTVDFATINVTATAGQDYVERQGTLTFASSENVKTITVPITFDQQQEADETFSLTLSNPSEGVVLASQSRAIITLLDTTGMAGHHFDSIAVSGDGTLQLTLEGGLHRRFRSYFDLYPIEVSTNLIDWAPLVMLVRTNSSTNALTYVDTEAGKSDKRFYRTVTNNLVTPFLQPTGRFPVGTVSRLLTDPTRRNRYEISTNGSFMVTLWYPAAPDPGSIPGLLNQGPLAIDPAAWGSYIDREPWMVSVSVTEPSCATVQAPYPVVLYSHGWTGWRGRTAERGADLASHGYVVVAVDHFDAFGTVFPDGTYLHGDTTEAGFSNAGMQDRIRDMRLTLDELVRWNAADPIFAGRLDLAKVASMGYSWGGGAAGELGRTDERVKGVIFLDAYLQNVDELSELGLFKPQIGIYSVEAGGNSTLFDKATRDAIWFKLKSSVHASFDDYYSAFGGSSTQRATARTINTYIVWFLNKYLKESSDPMPAFTDNPLVVNFKQK